MEQETKGLWAECVISTALYHCLALNHILSLPGETHTHTHSHLDRPFPSREGTPVVPRNQGCILRFILSTLKVKDTENKEK